MIVYNVKARWFAFSEDANAYRVKEGLRPLACRKVEINTRDQLARLLDLLCNPPAKGQPVPAPATEMMLDEAAIYAGLDFDRIEREVVPEFLKQRDGRLK